jgi:hypothetical protein
MYLSEPAAFNDVLAVLADLEQRINGNSIKDASSD